MSKEDIPTKESLIVALDGSPSSLAALKWAANYAERLSMHINVANAWQYHNTAMDFGALAFGSAGYVSGDDPHEWSKQILKECVEEVFGSEHTDVQLTSIEGDPSETLISKSEKAELLVMGSRGHSKLVDLILGSVSQKCLAQAKCPVVIVHAPENLP